MTFPQKLADQSGVRVAKRKRTIRSDPPQSGERLIFADIDVN